MKKYYELSNQEREKLLEEFCEAISVLNNPKEIMNFLTDLLTGQEVIMLAKRIKAAKLLLNGKNYKEIQESLKMGQSTIAKVNHWLAESGEGFRVIAERTKKEENPKENKVLDIEAGKTEWRKLKKRYPAMFWPQLLIEGIIGTMNKRQKDKVRLVLKKIDRKSDIYRNINKIIG
jgi:TrpR-related protein YerC/YecD